MENFYNSLKGLPVIGAVLTFAEQRPRLFWWIVLSLGIVILLLIEARDVGLQAGNWLALILASIVVAGLCIWIVGWEDRDEAEADGTMGKIEPPVAPTVGPKPDGR